VRDTTNVLSKSEANAAHAIPAKPEQAVLQPLLLIEAAAKDLPAASTQPDTREGRTCKSGRDASLKKPLPS